MNGSAPLAELLAEAERRVPSFLDDLRTLCAIDSGSYDADGVDAVADWCADRLAGSGMSIERIEHRPEPGASRIGDLVVGRQPGRTPDGKRLLLLAHMDTVFDAGTAGERPVRIEGDRITGPGVADDKGGLLAGLYALEILRDTGNDTHSEVVFCCSPDEEIGSPFSKPHLQWLAQAADLGFCLECGRENGDIVSARKGIADLVVSITGKAAHAGVEPERGRSAVLEAAHKTVALHQLNGRWPDVTVNVGVVKAGTRPNVVAERAELYVDVRASGSGHLEEALAAVGEIVGNSWVANTASSLTTLASHPPMERTPAIAALAQMAREVAADIGYDVADASTGGAADANTVAAVGLPVLDGLGPVGGDDHGPHEWISRSSIAPRVCLLAGLMAGAGAADVAIG